jgi:hypothetical protein
MFVCVCVSVSLSLSQSHTCTGLEFIVDRSRLGRKFLSPANGLKISLSSLSLSSDLSGGTCRKGKQRLTDEDDVMQVNATANKARDESRLLAATDEMCVCVHVCACVCQQSAFKNSNCLTYSHSSCLHADELTRERAFITTHY